MWYHVKLIDGTEFVGERRWWYCFDGGGWRRFRRVRVKTTEGKTERFSTEMEEFIVRENSIAYMARQKGAG